MSNIEKIKAEIERRIENYWSDGDVDSVVVSGELEELIDFIDSLPDNDFLDESKIASKELKEEIQKTIDKYPLNKEDMSEDDIATYHQGLIFGASHFAGWQREQMMKEVKYGVVCKNGKRDEEDVWIELNPGSLPDYKDTDPIDFIIVKED